MKIFLPLSVCDQVNFEVYITGTRLGFRTREGFMYKRVDNGYELQVCPEDVGVEFKHFALCDKEERYAAIEVLENNGYAVTGNGDGDPDNQDKWRAWFLISGFTNIGEGAFQNQIWK